MCASHPLIVCHSPDKKERKAKPVTLLETIALCFTLTPVIALQDRKDARESPVARATSARWANEASWARQDQLENE